MQNVKLTKNELKKQKDALKRFLRYLPTLQLKKQQLQIVLRGIEQKQLAIQEQLDILQHKIQDWLAIFADEQDFSNLLSIRELRLSETNIAGIDIPVFEGLSFETVDYDLFTIPLWVDTAIETLKAVLVLNSELNVLKRQYQLIARELELTTQRVNLFEKVRIPETRNHIRMIQIYLGDQQTSSVVRGKLAKAKVIRDNVA